MIAKHSTSHNSLDSKSEAQPAKPGIKTVLTAEVRYDKRLSSTAKIIHSEIAGLYKKHKVCWATNAHFAKKLGLTIKTISRCITHLAKLGYITVKINQAEGNKREIFLCEDTPEMSRPMDIPDETSGQNGAEKSPSLLIYKKNIKNKDEREGFTPSDFKSENFSGPTVKWQKPSSQEVAFYMNTLGLGWLKEKESAEARAFVDYYSALGWQMKAGPIQDWKAAVRNWLNKSQTISQNKKSQKDELSKINKGNHQWMGHINRLSTDRSKEYSGSL